MNLKKIIKETLDDFEWVRDISPYDISNKEWIIRFDVDCDLDEVRRIQEWIYSQGFIWASDATIEDMSTDCDSKYYFRQYPDDIEFDAYLRWNEPLQGMIDRGYVLYKWSEIRSTLQINESVDEFDWVRDTEFNPWYEYDYVFIDKEPTKENIESLVNMAFGSGRVNQDDNKLWLSNYDENVNTIINYFHGDGQSYIKIAHGRLYYGATASKKEDYNWVPYSQLF